MLYEVITRRDVAELDRKGAAETTAGLAILHFAQLHPGQLRQQRPRLRFHAELAQPRAAVVIGHHAREA